jgi:hypothetical protein
MESGSLLAGKGEDLSNALREVVAVHESAQLLLI